MNASTDSDWFLPYDGPIEPPPPPTRHPFAAEISQPKPRRFEHSHSRSRSRDAKRKSQRSYVALDAGGGVGAYPASLSDESPMGKHSDPPSLVLASHPFRMHSPPPRSHTASASLATPWVHTITAPAPPDPAPMRKRTLTYQPGLVTAFGSLPHTRVGYRESAAFLDLDDRDREKIRPTLLPPSLSPVGKEPQYPGLGVHDVGAHPYAARETRLGSASTASTTSGKPPVPPRSKASLKASMSTPELRIRIPAAVPPARSTGQTPRLPRSSSVAGLAATAALEARSICDALIFARPRFRVAHDITPPLTPDEPRRASVVVGGGGFKGLACFPRPRSLRPEPKEKQPARERQFQTVEEVLREGAQLDREREHWNALGQGSLLNSRARSVSRSAGGARIGGRARGSVSDDGRGGSPWGTLRLKRSVEMLAASAFSQGPAPSVSSRRHPSASTRHAAHPSVSTHHPSVSTHARKTSGSVASRGHSRNESWGQRVTCRSVSATSFEPRPEDYPVVDIRPVPTNRARAPRQPVRPPSPVESVIGLALSSSSGTTTPLVLPNHPFAQRAGAYPTDPAPGPPGPETIASRHRRPPRSSGSTERARLDDVPRTAPLFISRPDPPAPKSAPLPSEHPFVAVAGVGEVQRMFESAMLRSVGAPGEYVVVPRRGSGDSGLGSSVHDYAGSLALAARGSAFGPPAGLDAIIPDEPEPARPAPSPQEGVSSPQEGVSSSQEGVLSPQESSSSSFSSPRPLNSIDDIESLRDIFYRPSPRIASLATQDGERVLEQDEPESSSSSGSAGTKSREDWTFGRPFELQRESHLIWERRDDTHHAPLMINLAPGTPSPPPVLAGSSRCDVPESVHDSDTQSERSVITTSSQRATNENVTFGVVPSAQVDTLSVNVASARQSTALSLIDMYEYDMSQNHHSFASGARPSTIDPDQYPRESFYTASSAATDPRPGMDLIISGFPTPPAESASAVLSSYFVDTHSPSRRQSDA